MKVPRILKRAEHELDRHTEPEHPGDRKHMEHGAGDDPSTLREEQAAENAEPLVTGGPPFMTGGQWKGLVLGGLAGAVVGALLFLPVAFIPFLDAVGARIVLVLIIGGLAGATVGAVYWGGRTPELEHETVDVNGRPSIGTAMRDPGADRRGRHHE